MARPQSPLKNTWPAELSRRARMARDPKYDPTKDRLNRTPRWVHENIDNTRESLNDIQKTARKAGKHLDHGIPLQAKVASGLDVPSNAKPMPSKENISKLNRLPDDFSDFEWKHGETSPTGKRGRLSAWKTGPDGAKVRVPRAQGGFTNILTDPKVYKALGKVGLLAGGTAALEYFDPDNPIAQARQRGYEMTDQIGGLLGMEGIKGGIENMEPGFNKTMAGVGDSLFLDPVVTALGAGANMGDRLYGEMMGTNKKAKFKRTQGLGGRLQNRGLINGTP